MAVLFRNLRRVSYCKEQRAHGTFLFLWCSCISGNVMGSSWHQMTLEIGFRQSALGSSLLVRMWTAWSEQRLWQGSGQPVVFHHCSMPSNLFVCCLLMVTSDLLAGTECLKVSSKVRETAARTVLAGKSFCLEI